MSSKLSIPKSAEKLILFPARYLWLSAVVSFALWVAWTITMPGLGLTMTTKPFYFPEAPLWHIGLHLGAFATMGYSILGVVYIWLERNRQSGKS